jgi:ribonuclease P protein component
MLKRSQRITDNKDFQRIYRRGRYFTSAFFNLNYAPSLFDQTRIGLVVSKKVTKKATERNLLKRRLREICRGFYPELRTGLDIIVSVKPQTAKLDFDRLKEELHNNFLSASLFKRDYDAKKTSPKTN